jgi:ribosomal protein L3
MLSVSFRIKHFYKDHFDFVAAVNIYSVMKGGGISGKQRRCGKGKLKPLQPKSKIAYRRSGTI